MAIIAASRSSRLTRRMKGGGSSKCVREDAESRDVMRYVDACSVVDGISRVAQFVYKMFEMDQISGLF